MSEQRFTYLNKNGVRRTMIWDLVRPDEVTVHAEQDIGEILDGVHRDREIMNQRGPNKVLARVPAIFADKVLLMDDDELKHFLNDSDNEAFRIWRGRV
jgi:hypothetical protein